MRITDKIDELELQVEPLRAQSEKARKFLVLRDELRGLEISLWLEQLEKIRAGAIKTLSDYENAVRQKEEAQGAVEALYAAAEEHAAPDAFANQLLAAMNDHAAELDEIITAHLKGWTLSRVPRVSLVALRLALAEMLYGDEQKPGVAINEAVELVKKYGAEDDYQFVNGLLGAVARERGETPEPQC